MPATGKQKPSLLDRLIGKRPKNEQAEPEAISAKIALRRSQMQNAALYRLWDLVVMIAMGPTDAAVSVEGSAEIMAEASIDHAELDRLVKMVRNRAKRDTYASISQQSMAAFREARRMEHQHKEAKKAAIAQYDSMAKQAAQDATRSHAEFRRYRELADEASLPIPVVEQILDGVREENRRLRNTVASIEDQLAAAEKLADGAKAPVADLIAEFIRQIGHSNDGAKVERRNDSLCAIFEDLNPKSLADCTRAQIENWANDEMSETRIVQARRDALIFLGWCFQQGYTDTDLQRGESPSGIDHAKRIKALQASLEDARAELSASDDLVAEVEAEAEKPVPFHTLA